MEIIALIILGWCVFMMLQHPLKSFGFLFKGIFLFLIGFIVYVILFGCLMNVIV